MNTYRWATGGDLNAFFGLLLDNVAVLVLLVSLLTSPTAGPIRFTPEFVIGWMIPGTALGVLIGDMVYTWLAFRLAQRSGRDEVTAMPLGLDTPSTFGISFLVLLPALRDYAGDRDTAMFFAWHVGAFLLVVVGLAKTVLAPVGNAVRRWVPRAGLLGSLAAVALPLIAFLPLVLEIAAVPVVGFVALAIILMTLVAHRPLPGNLPGALVAAIVGLIFWFSCLGLEKALAWPLVPPDETRLELGGGAPAWPTLAWELVWWQSVIVYALGKLPVVLPFALATVVGGIDCTESAAAVGDEYDTRSILLTEGLASVAAGLAGGVIQNTPYIGHPAYKAMGGRAAYTLATALFIGAAGWFGWFLAFFEVLPKPVVFPILVFVGLEITGQSFRATPVRHYPAIALAMLPALAYMVTIQMGKLLGGQPPSALAAAEVQTLRCLASGFIVTSLLWGAALATLIDGQLRRSAGFLLVAAACSFVGIIHSPFVDAVIAWPWHVVADLPATARQQTPYHWTAAYGFMAGLILLSGWWQPEKPTEVSGQYRHAE